MPILQTGKLKQRVNKWFQGTQLLSVEFRNCLSMNLPLFCNRAAAVMFIHHTSSCPFDKIQISKMGVTDFQVFSPYFISKVFLPIPPQYESDPSICQSLPIHMHYPTGTHFLPYYNVSDLRLLNFWVPSSCQLGSPLLCETF